MNLIKGTQGTSKAPRFEQEDFINNIPDNVVTNIMDRLPLKDAVRTSILSRNWRFKWTMLSQLIFDDDFFECFDCMDAKIDSGRIISRILLLVKGVVRKFILFIGLGSYPINDEDISYWILFLSRNGIKDLTLVNLTKDTLRLPAHLFSCLELKRLKLVDCCFDPPASFHGFPNLLSLNLSSVKLVSVDFFKFFTQCPVLEILDVRFLNGTLKLDENAKLANLKKLSINYNKVDTGGVSELMGFFPKLQKLHLYFTNRKVIKGVAEKMFPATFSHLTTLELSNSNLSNDNKVSYVLEIIRSVPNIQTLKINSSFRSSAPVPRIWSPEVHYNKIGSLQQLRTVVFKYGFGSENELCLINNLLASCPSLKKFVIHFKNVKPDEHLWFARNLLKLQQAYPMVDIDICE